MTSLTITFPPPPADAFDDLRAEVRDFLSSTLAARKPRDRARSWAGFDADFSRQMGARGWIGMTWPKAYGGHERGALERYVVLEEMLAAGAPVAAHWIADRQSGPLLLKCGTEEQKNAILPRIAAGECFFCIGMSEPDSGSDLAAVRTRATQVDGGFRVNGTKLWTTYGHKSHYMILFCRTGAADDRHGGTSQLLVDLSLPGITVRPIADLSGEHHFNEVVFEDVFLPASAVIGGLGDGWNQVMGELAFERSGPERFLSSFTLLVEAVRALGPNPDPAARAAIGRLTGHIVTLRRLSRSVAGLLQKGENPALHAALVKDQGALLEQEIPEVVRAIVAVEPSLRSSGDLSAVLAHIVLAAPCFSLRGGTREILRGIIARGLGLR
ncbi:acyl-CoA dehydrogenase family protein [Xanthobacter dioxanivorans]|uniref:Acyl-CoA dehydrogenase family protein n=1 Tax=Xanthobacter dioxanivorans TaxID=2528964 RepID=A0A974SH17_9HYPH|nr:acyl-CoA dehydrogenase family protein [Xanthobacter dioxanivorans]QRG04644.1 acyl-CoA dehydrogenase family protein [Xanthobacter dioxanivorans]